MNLFRPSNRARIDPIGTQPPRRILVQNPGTDIMQMAYREGPRVDGHLERLQTQLEAHQRRNERLNHAFDGGTPFAPVNLSDIGINFFAPITMPYWGYQVYQEHQIRRNISRQLLEENMPADVTVETRGSESEEMSNLGYHI